MIVSLGERSRWFLAEFAIIIVGVLVALAIDEWREGLQDKEREQEFLQQLAADLQTTQDMFAEVTESNAKATSAALHLVEIFESDSEVDVGNIGRLLSEARYLYNPVPVLGTSEALVSTGDLRLIGDSRIRSALTRYLSRSRDFWLFPLYQMEEQHRNIYMHIAVLAQRYGISPAHRQGPSARNGKLDLEGFLADPDAYVYVARFAEIKAAIAGIRDDMSREAAELKALLPLAE